MFNSITGEITFKDMERIFLQTGGVEWEIHTSKNSVYDLPQPGDSARVFIYLHHRDDQLRLYGFSQIAERDLFLDLLKVEGVGPRQGLKILSGIEVHRFIDALESEDVEALAALPGLGKKTAQKILLKLKGKISVSPPGGVSLEEDVVGALCGMGFDRRQAREAVRSAQREYKESKLSKDELQRELFKKAIAQLSNQERT